MKRYKDQNIKEYRKHNIAASLVCWDSIDTQTRADILGRLIAKGWFHPLTNSYSSYTQQDSFKRMVECMHKIKMDYLSFKDFVPPTEKSIYKKTEIGQALQGIFTSIEDFAFYDFISLYINTLTDEEQECFIKDLNNFFQQLGVNKIITKDFIMPRQSEEIQKRVIEPIFKLLQSDSFSKINNELAEGLQAYIKKDYSSFILCSINALVSTLEYLATGEITQKRNTFNKSLAELRKDGKVTERIINLLKAINSYIEIERKEKTKAHTSEIKATEQEALFIFNLVMSVIQFLILNDKGTTK